MPSASQYLHAIPPLHPWQDLPQSRETPRRIQTRTDAAGWSTATWGPQSASTYRHCKESFQILSTLKTARDRPNSHSLTVASPTQLQRSPPKKQHPVVEDSAPAHPAVKAGQSRLETMVGGRGRHSINYVNTMGRGGSPRTSFQRDTFISKEVLSPHLLPGNEGDYFSSSYGENKGQGVVSFLSALFQLF